MMLPQDGRNFAVAGGVAKSVADVIHAKYPDKEVKIANAEGLKECRQLLKMATLGESTTAICYEGMACLRRLCSRSRNHAACEKMPRQPWRNSLRIQGEA